MSDVIHTTPDGFSIVLCQCDEGPYLGARKSGTPCCCERCGFMIREQWQALADAATVTAQERVLAEVETLIGQASFGVGRPEWKTATHNGAHDCLRVDSLRALVARLREPS